MSAKIDDFGFGFSWVMREAMTRTSHALATDEGVWLVDPVDEPEAMERVAALGSPAGVLQLLDRHNRDSAAIAARLGVPHLRVPDSVPGSPFSVVRVIDIPIWHEIALWWPERRVLAVAEAVGTNESYTLGQGAAGVQGTLRFRPPGALRGFQPEHLLVGHGSGVHGPAATEALTTAYARSRRDLPRLALFVPKAVKALVKR